MKLLSTVFCLLFMFSSIVAQRPANKVIKGVVKDGSSDLPLEFATISIYTVADSTLVTGGITEMDGSFQFEVSKKGPFYADIEYIGYETKRLSDIRFAKGNPVYNCGDIKVYAGGIALDEIEVRAERSELQFSLDKRVFNVGKDLASRGGSASDILDNIPSVTVGVEGEVSLRGSENVRILINGRPSGLLGLNGTDGLRNIQANMIERVEVITNPSSKFEAEGMAGIINIILKKDRSKGFNGSFEVTGGLPTQYGLGANVNYRQDRFNFFVNYNYRNRTGDSTGERYQEFYKGDTTFVSIQDQLRERAGRDHSFRFGSDFIINDNEVITAAFLYRDGLDNNNNRVTYRDAQFVGSLPADRLQSDDISQYILRTDAETEEEPTLEYSLRYDKKFKQKGHVLKADVSFQSNDESESSDFNESIFEGEILINQSALSQRSANQEGQQQWRMQLDYEKAFENGVKTESGLLGTFRQITNDYLVETLVDEEWMNEEGLSNNFIYNEDVVGAYANVGKEIDKFSFQLGLRAEYSRIKTELIQSNKLNDRDYLNLFPSAFLSYQMKGNNKMQASYSRRIRRPRFWDLNPFFTFTDRRNFFSGNPDLDPQYTDSYEIGHLKYWESGNIGSSIYYRRTTDLITRIQTQDPETQTTVRRPENLGIEQNFGVELVFAYTGVKWLRLDGSVNGFRFMTDGLTDEGVDLSVDNYAWTSNLNSRLSFWKNADLQVRVNYRAPRQTTQGSRKSITAINLGFSKDITKDLTITASVNDLLNNRKRRSIFESESLFEESEFQWRPRTFTVTVNYRINRKKERKRGGNYQGGGDGGNF